MLMYIYITWLLHGVRTTFSSKRHFGAIVP